MQFADGAADGAGGEPGAVLGAGRVGTELGAAAEHVLGGLLDVPGGALRGDADLLQLDPDRPAAERGERGLSVAVGERADGGEGVQGPVEEGGERGVGGLGLLQGVGLRAVGDLAALGAQFGDPLRQEVQELVDGDGSGGQLEEGEHLRHGRDDLGDGRGLVLRGLGVSERPGVEQGDPAAQYGAVVAVPGTQPPAGAGAVAVHLDEAGETGGVPVGADLSRGQAQVARRPVRRSPRRGWPCRRLSRCRRPGRGRRRPSGRRGPRRPGRSAPFWPAPRAPVCPPEGGARGGASAAGSQLEGAAARGRGRTSRSLESRGIRDVTGAVFRLTVGKPKRNVTGGDGTGQRTGAGERLGTENRPVVRP